MPTVEFKFAPVLFALAAALPVWAEDGLRVSEDTVTWPRWQARIGVSAPLVGSEPTHYAGASALKNGLLLGDYYFTGPGFGAGKVGGGLRATSGVLFGPRNSGLGTAGLAAPGLSLSARSPSPGEPGLDTSTVPYLGVGYTGVSMRGGWGFSADLGLMATPGNGGLRAAVAGPTLDDLVRDVRLTPVLQLGVSYSF